MADIKLLVDVDDNGDITRTTNKLDMLEDQAVATGGKLKTMNGALAAGKGGAAGGLFSRSTQHKIGQAGMQMGDFAVQVQGGGDALIAFSQQGSQLAGMIPGIGGAVAGLAIVIGSTLLKSLLAGTDAFESFGDKAERASEKVQGLTDVAEKWNEWAQSESVVIKGFLEQRLAEEVVESSKAANNTIKSIIGNIPKAGEAMAFAANAQRKVNEEFAGAQDWIAQLQNIDTSNIESVEQAIHTITLLTGQYREELKVSDKQAAKLNTLAEDLIDLYEQLAKNQELSLSLQEDMTEETEATAKAMADTAMSAGNQAFTTAVGEAGAANMYADGGVVTRTTPFREANGSLGIMGEAGPEAILPLKRGPNGKLGVAMNGGSGQVVINQSFNFSANGDDSVKKIIASEAPKIAKITERSIINSRQRGGSIRKVFG